MGATLPASAACSAYSICLLGRAGMESTCPFGCIQLSDSTHSLIGGAPGFESTGGIEGGCTQALLLQLTSWLTLLLLLLLQSRARA